MPKIKKVDKVKKLVAQDKKEYIIHIRNLKEALNCELVLKKQIKKSLNLIKKLV